VTLEIIAPPRDNPFVGLPAVRLTHWRTLLTA